MATLPFDWDEYRDRLMQDAQEVAGWIGLKIVFAEPIITPSLWDKIKALFNSEP